jgi:hypothetical protein
MTSSGGPGLLTSAVGPADISVDLSMLIGQRSTVKGGPRSTGPTGQPRPEADRWGPSGQAGKREKEKLGLGFGPKGAGPARLAQQARLGSWGQLNLRLSRPARFVGLAVFVGRLGL